MKLKELIDKMILEKFTTDAEPYPMLKVLKGEAITPEQFEKLKYPVIASPKIDGIRGLVWNDVFWTTSKKPIPNEFIQSFAAHIPDGFDGELKITGGFSANQSGIMSGGGEPDFTFMVFDDFSDTQAPYTKRLETLVKKARGIQRVSIIPTIWVNNAAELVEITQEHLAAGHEGTMIRIPDGPYKEGRSSINQAILLKIKPFKDTEATCLEVIEGTGKYVGKMGALLCDLNGVQFRLGSGFSDEQRKTFWLNRDNLIGQVVTFAYQEIGSGGRPRHPVFLGFRYDV